MFIKHNIQSEKVVLRPFAQEDIVQWNIWDADSKVQEYMPEPHEIMTQQEQENYFAECKSAQDEIHATIADIQIGESIGTIAITGIDNHHKVGELGLVIGDTAYWGKGYAAEALNLFIEYLQKETAVEKISAECEEENIRMQKVLEKNGFIKEGVRIESRIKRGGRINTVCYFKQVGSRAE